MTPGFEFQHSGEILWCHVRGRLQQILQFDEEWVVDTPRSETLWSETCQQNDITRGSAAALKKGRATSGPIGFTWWGWHLPQHVDLLAVNPAGTYRLRCSTVLGRPRPDAGEQLWRLLAGLRHFVPAGALVVDGDGLLRLVFSIAMDRSMAEEISQFTAGILHRHAAWAGYLAAMFKQVGLLDALPQPHPERGERTDPVELVAMLFTAGPQAVPSASGRPQSPEGACLSAMFAEGLPSAVANEIGWHYRASLDEYFDPRETVFSREAVGVPYDYFLYQVVENTSASAEDPELEAPPVFKNDPYLLLQMQMTSAIPESHISEVSALHEANARLWGAWSTGTANVLGSFVVNQDQDGFYVVGPSTIWPAASFAFAAQAQSAATVLSHLFSHLADQALNARLAEPSQDSAAPAESWE